VQNVPTLPKHPRNKNMGIQQIFIGGSKNQSVPTKIVEKVKNIYYASWWPMFAAHTKTLEH
jgi:hypothetical protein